MSCTFLVCVSPLSSPSQAFSHPNTQLQRQDLTSKRPRLPPRKGIPTPERQSPPERHDKLPLFGFLKLPPFLGFWNQPILSFAVFYRPLPPRLPPLSTPEPGPLHLEDFLLLMMFFFGHAVEIRRCRFQRHTDDFHLPKDRLCWSREPPTPGDPIPLDPPRFHVMCPGFHGEEYQ